MKIAVGVAHTGSVKAETAQCLAALMAITARETGADLALLFEGAGSLERKRIVLASQALEWRADHYLMVDTDQTFPPDGLLHLMRREKPIIAGNYPCRHGEPSSAALDTQGRPVRTAQGIEMVAAVGLGFCLLRTEVLVRIPRPWFASVIGNRGEIVCGEDVHFCNQARAAGLPVFVDHDLRIGHVAAQVLTLRRESVDADSVLPVAGAQ